MKKAKITISSHIDFLQIVTNFVERSSLVFGLGKDEALKLTLASEEIFSYLCEVLPEEKEIEVTCIEGVYFVSVEFLFEKVRLSLKAFNITASGLQGLQEDIKDLRDMGLLIAARSVEHLSLDETQDNKLRLKLIKDKVYPEPHDICLPDIKPVKIYSIKKPDADEIKIFSTLISAYYRDYPHPVAFTNPGKLSDMISSSIYSAVIAIDKTGLVVGGLIWRMMNEKVVEMFGPYLFNQEKEGHMAESLINACIENIARTEVIGIFSRFVTPEFPKGSFEVTGSLTWYNEYNNPLDMTTYYRALHEDTGTVVYIPKSIVDFIEKKYADLALPREVIITDYYGEDRGDHSVITSEIDRLNRAVTLQQMQPGKDSLKNLKEHIDIFKKEDINNIFFIADLGVREHLIIINDLIECGFEPRTIIPYGKRSDLIFFQYNR
ncbi:MAG TPA: hypothetical protein PKW07_00270 [Syntrophorhabdaceae bacterium]|nr:hypothetical protein [Syntrophorhabdaceae bacterium]